MRFNYILGILIVAMLLAGALGCSKENGVQAPAPGESPEQTPTEPEPGLEPEPEPVPEEPLSQELTDILAKNSKVNSYNYVYTENLKGVTKYYVTATKEKISYSKIQNYNSFNYFDIYKDNAKKVEYLVCADEYLCKGIKGTSIEYGTFGKKTPLQVAREIDNGIQVDEGQFDDKYTVVIDYINADGNQERVWVWTYWGMPFKREITIGAEKTTIEYSSLEINQISDADVSLPKDIVLS